MFLFCLLKIGNKSNKEKRKKERNVRTAQRVECQNLKETEKDMRLHCSLGLNRSTILRNLDIFRHMEVLNPIRIVRVADITSTQGSISVIYCDNNSKEV